MNRVRLAYRARPPRRLVTTLLLTTALLLLTAATAAAQDDAPTEPPPRAELNAEQLTLNAEGFQAAIDGDLDKAVRLYRASLHEGESNISWLNLGRALAGLGQCEEAVDAYERALVAPRVDTPSHDEVIALVERFRGDLPTQCPGKLRIVCSPLNIEVQIDDEPPRTCPAHTITLPPGSHTIIGTLGRKSEARAVEIVGLEEATVEIDIEAPVIERVIVVPNRSETPLAVSPPPHSPALMIAGWSTFGVGTAAVLGGTLVGALAVDPHLDEYRQAASRGEQSRYDELRGQIDTEQAAMLGLWIGGGVLMAGGISMVVVDAILDDDTERDPTRDESATGSLHPWFDAQHAGLLWSAPW